MTDVEAPDRAARTTTDAVAALQQDKVVDLTASLKLASGPLNPPHTASSLSVSDDGSAGQAKVRCWMLHICKHLPHLLPYIFSLAATPVTGLRSWPARARRQARLPRDACARVIDQAAPKARS